MSLEMMAVLANTPEWPVLKKDIVEATKTMAGGHEIMIGQTVDNLVEYRYIERYAMKYSLRPEGLDALKDAMENIEGFYNAIWLMIKAKE